MASTGPSDDGEQDAAADVVEFPRERVRPTELGVTRLCQMLGGGGGEMTGHWCSHCRGIWYGFKLEAECPVCGNRHG